jgi:hypothetical protein
MGKAIRTTLPAIVAAVCAAFLATIPAEALAWSTGITGVTHKSVGSGCVGCHGAAPDPLISVAITGPATLVAGQAGTYTVTSTRSGIANGTRMGVDIAASDAPTPLSIGADPDIYLDGASGELTHVSAAAAHLTAGSSASYQFTYTMPAAASAGSAHTLYATSALSFVGWNHATDLVVTTASAGSGARYVNAATGVNSGTCVALVSPCKTITYAMSQAAAGNPGDLVSVAPGTYNIALGETFPIVFKPGVQLVATGTPSDTVIDATGDTVKQGIVSSSGNASSLARIEGFTFRSGLNLAAPLGVALGGAIRITGSTGTFSITRNVFDRNEARGYTGGNTLNQTGGLGWGGGLYISSSTASVTNNVFVGNVARGGNGFDHPGTVLTTNEYGGPGEGGALYFAGTGTVANNTFHANTAVGGNGGAASNGTGNGGGADSGAVAAIGGPAPAVVNNIFSNNLAMAGTGGTPGSVFAGALTSTTAGSVTNSVFFGNSVNGGASTGDTQGALAVLANPQFHDAAAGNLHICLGSPAKGTGTAAAAPTKDFDGVVRPNPPSIGAFEPSAGPGDSDNDGIPDFVEIAEGTNPFVKDNDVFGNARLFTMQQYRDFLGREGDPAGVTAWANLVAANTYTRTQAIDSFLSSQEFAGFVSPVVRLYFATYLRIPDYAGMTFNAGLVRAGTVTITQLADFFATSPEFVATYGALNNTQFVTLLYNNVLGRAPDAGGLAAWVSALTGGMTRGQVLRGFSDSPEYQAAMANEVLVTMMYTAMLRRTPETSGFNAWLAILDALTLTREQVIGGFFLSTEYHNRFLP